MKGLLTTNINILFSTAPVGTNNVLVSAQMSALTANVVIGHPADCSIFWLRQLHDYYGITDRVIDRSVHP